MSEINIDDVMKIHEGGKIEIKTRVELDSISDLRKIYTPGVAEVCKEIVKNHNLKYQYTSIANTVAIVTDGTAVLGLGDIGAVAGMPVMEGKSVLFNKLAGISAIPILLKTKDVNEIVEAISRISETFGGILLEDIAAPRCFEIEPKLQEAVDIPVFHDDQHGTAVVSLASLMNALAIVKKQKEHLKVVLSGAGAAGVAITKILLAWGVDDVVLCDRKGAIYEGREHETNVFKAEIAKITNRHKEKGTLADVMKGKDVFIGVSGPGLVTPEMVSGMAEKSIVLALANPVPEIWPVDAIKAGAAVSLDGRTINNALAFPGIFRAALDARAKKITDKMKIAAAMAIAETADEGHIVPSILDANVPKNVAEAVRKAI